MDKATSPNASAGAVATSPRQIIKREDGLMAYYFSSQVAYLVVRATAFLPLRPNHFTAASLVLGLVAAWYFSLGDFRSIVIGLILLHVSFIFDCCDGQLSRLKGLQSKMGHWFDYHSDKIKDGATLLGFAIGAFHVSGDRDWWIFGIAFAAIFFQFLRNIAALNRDVFRLEQAGEKATAAHTKIAPGSQGQLLRSLKHTLLFKLSDRVALFTIFGLLGLAKWGVVVYAGLEVFYSLVSAGLNYRTFARYDRAQKSAKP
jgi:phosphatidylglycerophosphate synthase